MPQAALSCSFPGRLRLIRLRLPLFEHTETAQFSGVAELPDGCSTWQHMSHLTMGHTPIWPQSHSATVLSYVAQCWKAFQARRRRSSAGGPASPPSRSAPSTSP